MMPPTSDTPLIGIYFSLIMVMVACSVVCTVLILNYNKRTPDTHTMPQWVEVVFLFWLPWVLRMDTKLYKAPSYSSFLTELKMKQQKEGQPSPFEDEEYIGELSRSIEVDGWKKRISSLSNIYFFSFILLFFENL